MLRRLIQSSLQATRRGGWALGFGGAGKVIVQAMNELLLADYLSCSLAWNLQDLSPPSEQILFRFATFKDVTQWDVYSDAIHGGLSTATLKPSEDYGEAARASLVRLVSLHTYDRLPHRKGFKLLCLTLEENGQSDVINTVCFPKYIPPRRAQYKLPPVTGVFSGSLSTELDNNAPVRLKRSGFTGMRTMEGKHNLDLEAFDTLALKVKGDGRVYLTSLRTENWVMGPVDSTFNQWQAFLFAPQDEWFTVKIPFNRFLPTWRGKILNTNHEMNLSRITGLGISTTVEVGPEGAVTGTGDFRLELEWIKAIRSSES